MFHSELVAKKAALIDAYSAYKNAEREYMVASTPRYVSVLAYVDEIGVQMNYDQYKELAEIARGLSMRNAKPIRTGTTPIGTVYCFLEELLDEAFEQMTLPDEDEGEL